MSTFVLRSRTVMVIITLCDAEHLNTDTAQYPDDPMDIDQETVELPDCKMEIDFEDGRDIEMVDEHMAIPSGRKRIASVAAEDTPEARERRKRARMEHGLDFSAIPPNMYAFTFQIELRGHVVMFINVVLYAEPSNTDTTQQFDDSMGVDEEAVELPEGGMKVDFEGRNVPLPLLLKISPKLSHDASGPVWSTD
ncbi:hypothetical protein WOLCODRAFT_153176 [Wolfiporia cocos MD-104 SS10]|uniref:Uncharacterized protein n=1 Tax=Wolfiporia cocos (strain MD-104) TaxID=742152 RepID=A0A2H3JNP3_WOLCO|nr:hypothetical protein WOLCODRAFT_153176 [Wolfiporia cocos MD-104 SS10]